MKLVGQAFVAALRAYRKLLFIVAPIYAGIILLSHTPVLPWIASHMEPAMGAFGLPGGAALALVLGVVINIYAAIAACAGLALSPGHATTLALMLGFTHNLLVEGPLIVKLSRKAWLWLAFRIAIGLVAGFVFGPIFAKAWPGTSTVEGAVAVPHSLAYDLVIKGGKSVLQLVLIVFPIVFLLTLLEGVGALAKLRHPLRPVLRFLGFEEGAAEALIAGLFFGLVYGAGVIIDRVHAEGLNADQVGRLCLLLVLCHAIVEDTLLFASVHAVLWPVVLIRVAVAVGALLAFRLLVRPSFTPVAVPEN